MTQIRFYFVAIFGNKIRIAGKAWTDRRRDAGFIGQESGHTHAGDAIGLARSVIASPRTDASSGTCGNVYHNEC